MNPRAQGVPQQWRMTNRSRYGESLGDNDRDRQVQNVGESERLISASAGIILIAQGLARRDPLGFLIAGVGGALACRGATGHCPAYAAAKLNTAYEHSGERQAVDDLGTSITQSLLINKSPEELYAYWHNFENLPSIMRHLKSVRVSEGGRSHWVANAPLIAGREVEWDAKVTADEPNTRIAWKTLPGSEIEHSGSVNFVRAPGDRGTNVKVVLEYHPPAGQIGRWVAKLFGEEPEQQIHDDLRSFKRMMEVGEVLTTRGQPRGTCTGRGKRES